MSFRHAAPRPNLRSLLPFSGHLPPSRRGPNLPLLAIVVAAFMAVHLLGGAVHPHAPLADKEPAATAVSDGSLTDVKAHSASDLGECEPDGEGHDPGISHDDEEPTCEQGVSVRKAAAGGVRLAVLGYTFVLPPPALRASIALPVVLPRTPDGVRELGVQRI